MLSLAIPPHLRTSRYGDFQLTEAVRPARGHAVVPREGFRIETYRDDSAGLEVPMLVAAVSAERLFDVFLDVLRPLGPLVNVVLESSHESADGAHRDLFRDHMELPILQSHLCEFEETLCNDGCAGIAVISASQPMEVQFDDHKLFVIYANDLEPFERVLFQAGLSRDDDLRLISEGEHLHVSDARCAAAFDALSYRLGVAEPAEANGEWRVAGD